MRRVIAQTAHQIPGRDPVRVRPGDQVEAGERSDEWPEFVFVTAAHGAGWVPARYLSAASGPAVVREHYDTTELATQAGQELSVLKEDLQSGWLWCRSDDGREGWVPVSTIRPA